MNKEQILLLLDSEKEEDQSLLKELYQDESIRETLLRAIDEKEMELTRRVITLSQEIKDLDYHTDISEEEWAKYSPPKQREKDQLVQQLEQLELLVKSFQD